MEKWYICTYIHQKKRSTNHPNVGKYTIFPMDDMATKYPTYTSNPRKADPSLRQRGPWCAPLGTAPRALGVAGVATREATIQFFDPRQQSLGKIRPKKHIFLLGELKKQLDLGWSGICFFWKMISDLMWWFDTLMIGEGWWVMGNDEEEIVHMFDSRSLRSN